MSAEPEELTWCCDAPATGIGQAKVCMKCGNYARTRRVWNGLPAPGTFEKPMRVRGRDGQPLMDG